MLESILHWVHENERPAASIISVSGAALLALAKWVFSAKTKVEWSKSNDVTFTLPAVDNIHVERFSIFNSGRKAAEDVEISINARPSHINIYPNVKWSIEENPDSSIVVKIPMLNGAERVNISMLTQGAASPTISHLRYKGGNGTSVTTELKNVESKWYIYAKWSVTFIGVATIIGIIATISLPYIPKNTRPAQQTQQ